MKLRRHQLLPWLLGDVLALSAFVFIGQVDHGLVDAANPLWGVLEQVLLFGAPWVLAGLWLGAFRFGEGGARAFLARSLNTWLVAAPLGLLLRSYVLGRAVVPTAFISATLFFGGMFVLGWRALFVLGHFLVRRRRSTWEVKKDEQPHSLHAS
ncbi:MAG: DUF3054 domain-containing protein [Anaerolineales bacterium]|nr:DUF3054 domain-containing protein [Anaerolineales bacterium]